jgi:uncharacterized protein YbbC (DUF1343 family)
MGFIVTRQSVGARVLACGLASLAIFVPACTGDRPEAHGAEGVLQRPAAQDPSDHAAVLPGIAVLLSDSIDLVAGRAVGLITNHTGLDGQGRSSIDLLHEHPSVQLVALFSPEHGIRGTAEAGVLVDSGRDEQTGLPVHSLYGSTRKPSPEMLEGIDVLLFDIQDIGARYYTYVSTMALAMEAAGEAGIPFIVLDRPNPLGGSVIQGNVLDPSFASFVGMYPVPMRHGMTTGELARMFAGEFGVEVDLLVVPADGWRRSQTFEDTGLPWRAPSPNIPTIESALHYPGTCLFEGTNLSVGRGTDRAFQHVGAPWLDGRTLAQRLNAHGLPGVRFEATTFTPLEPGDGKFDGQVVSGVQVVATDSTYDPTRAAVAMLVEARALAGATWEWRPSHFDRLAGTDRLRSGIEAGQPIEALTREWDAARRSFEGRRARYLLYP